jgi:O-antigen/teichoic acid export membrane protein
VTGADDALLGQARPEESLTVARNVSTRYLAIGIEAALGLLILPYNVAHLGQSAYGLWMLTASVTLYFSVLDLGYSGALVKFVAQYRARRDIRALNEILSTTFCIFTAVGVVTYLVAIVLAVFFDRLFQLSPDQVHLGRIVLLIVTANVAVGTAFSVFGGVINGFQRYDLNNVVGTLSSIATAIANIVVLGLGYGLVELVAVTTTLRILTYGIYRANAYRVFPGLRLRLSSFRRARLREITGLSVYMLLIDWAHKINYSVDALVVGAFLNTSAVAVWIVAQRLAEVTQRLTNQLNDVLFPTVVDNDASAQIHRLQAIFVQGTRLSLAAVMPLGGAMILLARPLVLAWVGPPFEGAVIVLQLLSVAVIVRVGNSTASTVLKGAGNHRLLAWANVSAALMNVALSIAIVKPLGLAGVALGTLIPVCAVSMLVVFPAGCRRVGMSVAQAVSQAVWPAVWPAGVMAGFVLATRDYIPDSLLAVAAAFIVAAVIYGTTFYFFGISAQERRFYTTKLGTLTTRWRFQAAPEGV